MGGGGGDGLRVSQMTAAASVVFPVQPAHLTVILPQRPALESALEWAA